MFSPEVDLHAHALLEAGKIILQDKASCMPPYALVSDILPGVEVATSAGSAFSKMIMSHDEWRALDACAAPGNKTSLLAALLKQSASAFHSMFVSAYNSLHAPLGVAPCFMDYLS